MGAEIFKEALIKSLKRDIAILERRLYQGFNLYPSGPEQ
jgi:hypothetical protein